MAGAARDRLRAVTADIHQALHDAEPFARIAAGRMDHESYTDLLMLLYRYHATQSGACAAGAQRLAAPQLAASHAARLDALRDDLDVFGCKPSVTAIEEAADPDFAVGCLYTVQGSTLGGKVIHRQLASFLPQGRGRIFFAGSGDDGAHWRLFCEQLETCAPGLDFARVEAGACHAFGRFRALLDAPAFA